MQIRNKIYINGKWVPSQSTRAIAIINAASEEVMGKMPNGSAADVSLQLTQ